MVTDFEVVRPQVDEAAIHAQTPRELVLEAAEAKARAVARVRPDALVIGADTVVACREGVIGKPVDRADAVRILRRLTRSPHDVLTGLCLVAPDGREVSGCVAATLQMRQMSDAELERLADRPGALDRAGAYELQPDDPNVVHLDGHPTTVMGLPLEELERAFHELYP